MKVQSITHPSEKLVPDIGRSQSKDDIYGRFFNFFGLRENPFNVNPDPRYLFLTRPIQEALEALTYGVQTRKGFIVLTGEVGTGKTTLINCLLNGLRQQRPIRFHPGRFRNYARLEAEGQHADVAQPVAAHAPTHRRDPGFDSGRSARPAVPCIRGNSAVVKSGDLSRKV